MEHKGTVVLETERLVLRPFREEDASDAFRNWTSDDEVTKYLTWPTHQLEEHTLGFLKYCIQGYADPTTYQWGIALKGSDEVIGNISVVRIREDIDEVELGWVLGRKFWGQGYMPEAAGKVIDFLFDEVGANRIMAAHDRNNPKSGRVMQKVGMTYEGTQRQCARNNQGIVDCCFYAILKSDR